MTSITGYDGIGADAAAISRVAQAGDAVFHYQDGIYAWTAADLALFDGRGVDLVAITVFGDPSCAVGDVENGDMTPQKARGYIRARRRLGHQACIYCNQDTLPKVRAECQGLIYNVLIALWDGTREPVPGTIGKQYLPGPDYDTDVIYDPFWRRPL
jgi:hypothetical protein